MSIREYFEKQRKLDETQDKKPIMCPRHPAFEWETCPVCSIEDHRRYAIAGAD